MLHVLRTAQCMSTHLSSQSCLILWLNSCLLHWTDLHVWDLNCWPFFSARATGVCYRLLQKLRLWPAVIPDHKSLTPQTK